MEQRRSGIPGPSSSIPKRAPSPSSAAFASRTSNVGPLGSYRPPSRDGSAEPAPASGAKRFGFAAATPSTRIAATPSSKRTVSSAGLQDGTANGGGSASGAKRPFLTAGRTSTASTARMSTSSTHNDQNASLEAEFKRRELLSQQAYERLQQELSAKGRELDKEREERLAVIRQWESFSEEVNDERQALKEQRKFLQDRVNELQENNNSLSSAIDTAESERAKAEQSAQSTRTQLAIRVADLEAQLSTAIAELESQKEARRQSDAEWHAREAEWEDDKLRRSGQSNNDAALASESAQLTKELSSLLTRTRKLEAENAALTHENTQLQSRKDSVETLKEQKRDLEKKVVVVDELRRRVAEYEAQVRDLEAAREHYRASLQGDRHAQEYEKMFLQCADPDASIPEVEEPATLTQSDVGPYISKLHGSMAGLAARARALQDRVGGLRKHCEDAEASGQEELERVLALTHELSESKTARLKSDKARETMAMEMDSYRRLLDTYQQEAQNLSAQYDGASAEQIALLESQLQARTGELDAAVQELNEVREMLSSQSAPGGLTAEEKRRLEHSHELREKELMRSVEEGRQAFVELEKQCVSLGKTNDDLFLRLGRGEFDQSKLRVLELSKNPVSQDRIIRTSTLDALRKENAELLSQLESSKSMAVAVPGGTAMVPTQTLDNLRDEYRALQQTMRDRDKAFDRLKEAFGAKATEYVAAVKALFGYDMHVLSRGKVKLRSVYARTSKGTSLTFDAGDDDDIANMRLVGEARQGAANVANLKRYWLGADRCSVPCFLSALQLELYESTTQAARGGWVDGDE